VPMGFGATLYSSIGDVLGWAALAGLTLFIIFHVVVRMRAWQAAKNISYK
jgi:hypothetical protein